MTLAIRAGLFTLAILTAPLWAAPKETVETINGYEVHFVDTGSGDSFAATFFTPHGTLHDSGPMLGRAHLLEHLLFTGTPVLPGYHTYDETLKPAGVTYNAYTADSHTFYHAAGNAQKTELIMRVELSMLGGLEWNPDVFVKERDVVINEIAQENNYKDPYAFRYMGLTKLLPAGHPWARPRLGDDSNLRAMTIENLKEFYHERYTPEHVHVALIGNFSDPAYLAQVREWTHRYLQPFPAEAKHVRKPEAPVPSLFSSSKNAPESQRLLYLHSESLRDGMVVLEPHLNAGPAEEAAYDVLETYLNLDAPGSLKHRLRTELGWATDVGVYSDAVGGHAHIYFQYTPSETGERHHQEIRELFFSALRGVQELTPEMLDLVKTSVLMDWERSSRSVAGMVRPYARALTLNQTLPGAMNLIRNVKLSTIKRLAGALRPDRALYMEMGPDAADAEEDPIFRRKFRLSDNRENVDRAMKIWQAPVGNAPRAKLIPVALELPPESAGPGETPSHGGGNLAVLDLRRDLPDNAVSVRLDLRAGRDQLVALDLINQAFTDHLSGELAYLNLKHQVQLSVSRSAGSLVFTALGEDRYSSAALKWMLERYHAFEPSREELTRARERYVDDHKSSYMAEFSAFYAFESAEASFHPSRPTALEQLDLAESLALESLMERAAQALAASDKTFILTGDLKPADYQSLRTAAWQVSPKGLNPEEGATASAITETVALERPFPISKGENAFAMSRSYPGPMTSNLEDSAAFLVLNSVLAMRVTAHNRGDQGLGYIHTTSARPFNDRQHFLTFLGQTEGPENVRKTLQGWEDVMAMFRSGTISDQEIQDSISGLTNELSQEKTSAKQHLAAYARQIEIRKDAQGEKKLLELVKRLTPADVRAVAEKYLFAPAVPYRQELIGPCEKLLGGA